MLPPTREDDVVKEKPPPIHRLAYWRYGVRYRRIAVWQGRMTGTWYVDRAGFVLAKFHPGEHGKALAKAVEAAHG